MKQELLIRFMTTDETQKYSQAVEATYRSAGFLVSNGNLREMPPEMIGCFERNELSGCVGIYPPPAGDSDLLPVERVFHIKADTLFGGTVDRSHICEVSRLTSFTSHRNYRTVLGLFIGLWELMTTREYLGFVGTTGLRTVRGLLNLGIPVRSYVFVPYPNDVPADLRPFFFDGNPLVFACKVSETLSFREKFHLRLEYVLRIDFNASIPSWKTESKVTDVDTHHNAM